MNGRTIAAILLTFVVIVGAIGLGVTAYNAGVTAGLAQTGQVVVTNGGYVAPGAAYVGYGWGFGWGHGFGFFGFLGGLLFLFLIIGLVRAAFGGPRRGWGPGYGHRHGWGPGGWEDRAREAHDAWHREHPESPDRPDRPSVS
ncbi:MAG TPA: hypothetical protein VFJ71_08780 [Candidatus Limnocylindrales bacterium]|nr:hypothetical protein [Candidatus Limnocylindrales bacterium]